MTASRAHEFAERWYRKGWGTRSRREVEAGVLLMLSSTALLALALAGSAAGLPLLLGLPMFLVVVAGLAVSVRSAVSVLAHYCHEGGDPWR